MPVKIFCKLKILLQMSVSSTQTHWFFSLILNSGLQNDHRKWGSLGFCDSCALSKAVILSNRNLKFHIIEVFVECRYKGFILAFRAESTWVGFKLEKKRVKWVFSHSHNWKKLIQVPVSCSCKFAGLDSLYRMVSWWFCASLWLSLYNVWKNEMWAIL